MVEGRRRLTYNSNDKLRYKHKIGGTDRKEERSLEVSSRIKLTGKQFFVLTGIVGARAVIGLEDPFRGTLAEEMPVEVAKIEQEPQEKGLIDTAGKEPVLVEELLEYIEVCDRTLLTIHMRVSGSDEALKECFIYYSSSLVVGPILKAGLTVRESMCWKRWEPLRRLGLKSSVTCGWRIGRTGIQLQWICLKAGSSNG